MSASNNVAGFYRTVMGDVMKNCRDAFLNEGVDEQVLRDLSSIWKAKVEQSQAVDINIEASQTAALGHQLAAAGALKRSHAAAVTLAAAEATVSGGITPHPQMPMFSSLTAGVGTATHPGIKMLQARAQAQLQAAAAAAAAVGPSAKRPCIDPRPPTTIGASTITQSLQKKLPQLDGTHESSSEDEDEDDDNDDDDDDNDDDDDDDDDDDALLEDFDEGGDKSDHVVEEPLGPGDDGSESDGSDIFDTENVVVCQFDKVNRTRNKWKFTFKDGIMNLNGKDHVFLRSTGEAEW